jgi:hypothetical protein
MYKRQSYLFLAQPIVLRGMNLTDYKMLMLHQARVLRLTQYQQFIKLGATPRTQGYYNYHMHNKTLLVRLNKRYIITDVVVARLEIMLQARVCE